jgi:hypothetical protein
MLGTPAPDHIMFRLKVLKMFIVQTLITSIYFSLRFETVYLHIKWPLFKIISCQITDEHKLNMMLEECFSFVKQSTFTHHFHNFFIIVYHYKRCVISHMVYKVQTIPFFLFLGGVGLSPLGTAATTGLLYQPQVRVIVETGRGNWNTLRKPAPVPLCLQQIPLDQTWDRTRATAVESRRLAAWAEARLTKF